MPLTNLNKLFIRVTNGDLRPQVIEKSKKDNKIYFLTTTQEIVTHGAAYGLSTDVQDEITKIKSILKTYYDNGTEDAVKAADQTLYGGEIPTENAATISGNAANIAALTEALADPATFWEDYTA